MITLSRFSRKTLIKKYNLDPNFRVMVIPVLNVPATFIGLDKKSRDCWISQDRKIIYVVEQGVDKTSKI